MSAPVAVANAVNDALEPLGVSIETLPITPSKLWGLLNRVPAEASG
jgi:2-furoyl-CoA dehydrogenase large subunit